MTPEWWRNTMERFVWWREERLVHVEWMVAPGVMVNRPEPAAWLEQQH